MTIENQDFTMPSGDTKKIHFTISLPDEMENLNNCSIKWVLATKSGDVIVTKQLDSGVLITGNNLFIVLLDPEDTENLCGSYKHEAQITDVFGNVSTVSRGTVIILRDIA